MPNKARWSTGISLNSKVMAALLGLQLALGSATLQQPAKAELTVETHDLLEFKYQMVGASEEEAVRQACLRAVHATVGRVLFSDYSLQAEDLLTAYISKNWQQYVASYYVLERRADREGFGVLIRVQTFPERVTRDLREKKFLVKPSGSPTYAVFVSETVNNLPTQISNARLASLKTLNDQGLRVQDSVIPGAGFRVDLNDAASVAASRAAAVQAGAEVLVLGSADTVRIGQEKVLLDDLITYESTVDLVLVRVNDGRVLDRINRTVRYSGKNENEAAAGVTDKAMGEATAQLLANSKGLREREVKKKTKFNVMFTDLTQDELKTVATFLQSRLSYGTRAYVGSWHGNVGVLNIDTERDYSALERAVIDFTAFNMRITDRQGRRITVDVQH